MTSFDDQFRAEYIDQYGHAPPESLVTEMSAINTEIGELRQAIKRRFITLGLWAALVIILVLGVLYADSAGAHESVAEQSSPSSLTGTASGLETEPEIIYRPTQRCRDLFAGYCDGPLFQRDCAIGAITPEFCTEQWFAEARPAIVGGYSYPIGDPRHESLWAITKAFRVDQWAKATKVAYCESKFWPAAQNRRSSAGGLLQFLDSTWANVAATTGRTSKYDPYDNAFNASYLVSQSGWAPWAASRSCWGR